MFNKKILALGNETDDTNHLVQALADQHQTMNHGLISDPSCAIDRYGYYHTTLVDLNEIQIQELAKRFDQIVWLDQPQESYPHYKSFLRTFRLIKTLEEKFHVIYRDNQNARLAGFWWDYLRTNPSFCFHPFLALIPDDHRTIMCPKRKIPIKQPEDIEDWHSDPDYRRLRDTMLDGRKLPNHCVDCYDKEDRGIESTRQFETLEWAVRMRLRGPEDFNRVKNPVFYEIRPSNKCNLMCRMCDDVRSHLIEKEYIKINKPLTDWRFKDLSFDQIKIDTLERVYLAGGEPTIMPEVHRFLQSCIDHGRTDFELCIGTNGMKFSNKLLDLLSHFSDVVVSLSFDGYGIINDYIRWRSDFATIHRNGLLLQSLGHKISLQTVPSIYNVTRLHEVFEFYQQEFPGSSCLVQAAEGHDDVLRPWNHPRADLVLESMERCRKTNQYLSIGRSCKTYIDQLHALYSDPDYRCDLGLLAKFFEYNDTLDRARGSQLGDYIPELEACRKLLG